MLTIRERILQSVHAQLSTLTISNGYYTDVGSTIIRGRPDADPTDLPCTILLPSGDLDIEPSYTGSTHQFDLNLVSFMKFRTHNPGSESEKVLGDLITCLTATRLTHSFTHGYRQPRLGQTLTGATSGSTCILESLDVTAGTWDAHVALGTMNIRLPYEELTPSEYLLNDGGEFVCIYSGTTTRIPPLSGLVNFIHYTSSILPGYPEPGEDVVKVSATFTIEYATLTGNPYQQGV